MVIPNVVKKNIIGFIVVFLIFVVILYAFLVEPNRVDLNHVYIKSDYFYRVLKDKTVLHLSDIHIGSIGRFEKKILKSVNDLAPDLIFLTGDYVKWQKGYDSVIEFLARLKAKSGIWGVMGDYDYSSSRKSCIFCHTPGTGEPSLDHDVRFLKNSFETIEFKSNKLLVGGIDVSYSTGFEVKKNKTPTVVLSHSPLVFDSFDNDSNILVLAGDTHGGQVPLPGWVWKLAGYGKCSRYSHGLFSKGNNLMYVSRGIGTSHIPLRFLRPPEITVLHFTPSINNTPEFFVLLDFELDSDLNRIEWKCKTLFAFSEHYATHGKRSLKIEMFPGDYPGLQPLIEMKDWRYFASLRFDVFNPSLEPVELCIRIDDRKDTDGYNDRYNSTMILEKGMNAISIPLSSLYKNGSTTLLDLKSIEKVVIFLNRPEKKQIVYIDYLRLVK